MEKEETRTDINTDRTCSQDNAQDNKINDNNENEIPNPVKGLPITLYKIIN